MTSELLLCCSVVVVVDSLPPGALQVPGKTNSAPFLTGFLVLVYAHGYRAPYRKSNVACPLQPCLGVKQKEDRYSQEVLYRTLHTR